MYMNVGKTQMREKFEDCGTNLAEFNKNLNETIDSMSELVDEIRQKQDNPEDTDAVVETLYQRYINREQPFKYSFKYEKSGNFRESIMADGLYSIYLHHFLQYFKKEQILTIDGSELSKFWFPCTQLILRNFF